MRERVSIVDVAPTLAHRLGRPAPSRSIGTCFLCDGAEHAGAATEGGPVVVVLPAHEEAVTIAAVIDAVPPTVRGRRTEVVVVDDGSTDGTADVALAAGAKVISHDGNHGLGAAVRTGLDEARRRGAAAVAFLDADGEYDPAELDDVVAPIFDGTADYVVGSRFAGMIHSMLPHRRIGNGVLTAVTSFVARRRLTDGQSGFRALGPNALRHAAINHDYNYAQVLTIDLLRKGFRYAEVPITYSRRTHGRSFVKLGRYLSRVLPALARATRVR